MRNNHDLQNKQRSVDTPFGTKMKSLYEMRNNQDLDTDITFCMYHLSAVAKNHIVDTGTGWTLMLEKYTRHDLKNFVNCGFAPYSATGLDAGVAAKTLVINFLGGV